VKQRLNNLSELKAAKAGLKAKIAANESHMQLEFELVKNHYTNLSNYLHSDSASSDGNWLGKLSSQIFSTFITNRLPGSRSNLVTRLGKILLRLLLK